jgi:UDPglucose 6-dehydrogenase
MKNINKASVTYILLGLLCTYVHIIGAGQRPIITMVGTGYVGLVSGAGLAEIGNNVICADVVQEKIDMLHAGIMPIFEKDLKELVDRNVGKERLSFTADVENAVRQAGVLFIAVGTPMAEDGQADLSAINHVIQVIAKNIHTYKLIVIKSTVPVGTCSHIRAELQNLGVAPEQFDIVSNPEFLREGIAVHDFLNPDRIVIGLESERAREIMQTIYQSMIEQHVPVVFTNLATSETIKYASNAFLAAKISFINEIANLCGATGASVYTVARAMGLDNRIGPLFLNPGPGFGGACFPKDCQALMYQAHKYGVDLKIVEATLQANECQKEVAVKKLSALMQKKSGQNIPKEHILQNKTVAVLGLAFKANTDDTRYSPAIISIKNLLDQGAIVRAYDPEAAENMRKIFPAITYVHTPYEALDGADACIMITEWQEFKALDIERVAQIMKQKVIVDMRGILDRVQLEALGFYVDTIGR